MTRTRGVLYFVAMLVVYTGLILAFVAVLDHLGAQ
jgi:hypothetical protein